MEIVADVVRTAKPRLSACQARNTTATSSSQYGESSTSITISEDNAQGWLSGTFLWLHLTLRCQMFYLFILSLSCFIVLI